MWVVGAVLAGVWLLGAVVTMAVFAWQVRPSSRCQCGKVSLDADVISASNAESIIHEEWRCYPAREVIAA
jgi:hypothetical protein